MVEETQTTPTTKQTTVPDWQQKANEMSKQIGQGLFVQLAYRSDNSHDCEPILLSDTQTMSVYPIVIEAPAGLSNPTYLWAKHQWIEQDENTLAMKVSELTQKVDKIDQNSQNGDLTKEIQEIKKSNKDYQESNQQQMGQLLTMVSTLMASSKQSTGPTTPTINSSAASPTETANQATASTKEEGAN